MTNHEMALAVSAGSFGMFVGFLAGYAARAYISYLRPGQGKVGEVFGETEAVDIVMLRSVLTRGDSG